VRVPTEHPFGSELGSERRLPHFDSSLYLTFQDAEAIAEATFLARTANWRVRGEGGDQAAAALAARAKK